MGHTTKQVAAPINRITPRWSGPHSPELIHRKIFMVGCGGFSKGYSLGAKQGSIPMGSYVEQRLLNPAILGAPIVKIRPAIRWERHGARRVGRQKSTWSPEITVEL